MKVDSFLRRSCKRKRGRASHYAFPRRSVGTRVWKLELPLNDIGIRNVLSPLHQEQGTAGSGFCHRQRPGSGCLDRGQTYRHRSIFSASEIPEFLENTSRSAHRRGRGLPPDPQWRSVHTGRAGISVAPPFAVEERNKSIRINDIFKDFWP